jgi:hypothetical protein
MKHAWVLVLVIACGNKEADKPAGSKPAGSAPQPAGGPPPTEAAVKSGELVVTGDFSGTFKWKQDLAVQCTWIPDVKGGGMDVTLTDGAKFMSFGIKNANDVHKVEVTSGALKSASMLTSEGGFTMTGSDDSTHMSVTVDTDVASKDAKAHIKGAFELACPHL